MTLLAQLGDPPIDPDPPISPWLVGALLAAAVLILAGRWAWRHRHTIAQLADAAQRDAQDSRR